MMPAKLLWVGRVLALLWLLAGFRPAQAQLYVVRDGQLPYAGHTQASVNVVVDGAVDQTRAFFQDYLRDVYRLSFKSGLGGLVGKKTTLTAKQATSSVSGRPVDLYVAFTALADSTTEVALFGSFSDKGPITPELAAPEYQRLRDILTKFAPAARYNAYQQQVRAAEADVLAADKERDKLTRSIQSAQSSTAANLRRIEELLRQNQANAAQMHADSAQLTQNAQRGAVLRQVVQRRRARLSTVAPR